jgi:hypothetical protein
MGSSDYAKAELPQVAHGKDENKGADKSHGDRGSTR